MQFDGAVVLGGGHVAVDLIKEGAAARR